MYLGELNEIESDLKLIDEFSRKLNTRYHEATLAFSPDETRVYFTRNNYDGDLHRDDKGTNHLKLYSAELRRTEDNDSLLTWQNVKELPFNSEDYSVGHPTVSSDGKLLYFVTSNAKYKHPSNFRRTFPDLDIQIKNSKRLQGQFLIMLKSHDFKEFLKPINFNKLYEEYLLMINNKNKNFGQIVFLLLHLYKLKKYLD